MLLFVGTISGVILILQVYRRPALSFALVLSMFGIEQVAGTMSTFFLRHQSIINVAIGILILVSITGIFVRRELVITTYFRSAWIAIALYLLSFSSLVWTPDPGIAWNNWAKVIPYVITLVMLMPLLVQRLNELKNGLYYLALIGLIIVILINVFGEYQGRKLVMADDMSTGNPLAVGQLGGYVIFAVVLQQFTGLTRFFALVRWGIVITAVLVIAYSGSRGQLIFMFGTLLLFLPWARQVNNLKSVLSVAFAVILLVLIADWVYGEYLEGSARWSAEGLQHSAGGRFQRALVLLDTWLNSPGAWFFGLGTSASFAIVGFYPHIVPLEIIGEEGILGIILFLAFTYRSWQALQRLMKRFEAIASYAGRSPRWVRLSYLSFCLCGNKVAYSDLPYFSAYVSFCNN